MNKVLRITENKTCALSHKLTSHHFTNPYSVEFLIGETTKNKGLEQESQP